MSKKPHRGAMPNRLTRPSPSVSSLAVRHHKDRTNAVSRRCFRQMMCHLTRAMQHKMTAAVRKRHDALELFEGGRLPS